MKSNRVVLVAIAGAAVGAIIIRTLGSERAKEVMQAMEGNIKTLGQKIMDGKDAAMLRVKAS